MSRMPFEERVSRETRRLREEVGDRRLDFGKRVEEFQRIEAVKNSDEYRNSARRKKEINRLRIKIRNISGAKSIRGGEEYQFFEGDNYENEYMVLAIVYDNIAAPGVATIRVRYDKVVYYLSDEPDAVAELRKLIAESILHCVAEMDKEIAVMQAKVNAVAKLRHEIAKQYADLRAEEIT